MRIYNRTQELNAEAKDILKSVITDSSEDLFNITDVGVLFSALRQTYGSYVFTINLNFRAEIMGNYVVAHFDNNFLYIDTDSRLYDEFKTAEENSVQYSSEIAENIINSLDKDIVRGFFEKKYKEYMEDMED